MKWSSFGVKAAVLAVGLLLVGMLGGGTASAYPPPTGSASMSTSNSTPATGTSVSISTTVLNQYGLPASGLSCTFQVLSQPGSSAVVDAGPKVTDENGVTTTTLNVGTTAGTIVVGANCGEVSSQISVEAQGAPAGTIAMPATGEGHEAAPTGPALVTALLAVGLTCVAGSVSLRRAAKKSRNS